MLIWDGTVLEKPESLSAEGLCAVRSSKALRLTHVKKGYYHPPGKPIFVPGPLAFGSCLRTLEAARADEAFGLTLVDLVGRSPVTKKMKTASSYA